MKRYWVIWHYYANYSGLLTAEAESAEEAIKKLTSYYTTEFSEHADIYVFDKEPVLKIMNGRR